MLGNELKRTLGRIAEIAATADAPWWIVSGAAAALRGAETDVRDVDLMMSASDARRTLARLGIGPKAPPRSNLFRSAVFGRWCDPPLPVDIMGDFHVAAADGWHPVAFKSREAVSIEGSTVFVPSKEDLIGMLRTFGRPKDIERAELLTRVTCELGIPERRII